MCRYNVPHGLSCSITCTTTRLLQYLNHSSFCQHVSFPFYFPFFTLHLQYLSPIFPLRISANLSFSSAPSQDGRFPLLTAAHCHGNDAIHDIEALSSGRMLTTAYYFVSVISWCIIWRCRVRQRPLEETPFSQTCFIRIKNLENSHLAIVSGALHKNIITV